MCSSQGPKTFPPPRLATGGTTLPASVFASNRAPGLTDVGTQPPMEQPLRPKPLPTPGRSPIGDANPANPYLLMLSQLGMMPSA